ncbi:aldo/keto reductase [Sphingomonas sp. LM7]|uniref:aldo/keto reductase n=1 Tax=Sphingomonas sp. LM7 TaxID=1938607 RepID=UPI000983F2AA|nr:aldo/keto reductase [Sphingomonas sp. LM7]AQR74862.1 hypothetical protein BXU08_15435 [Sphingomonas sp. LM7]
MMRYRSLGRTGLQVSELAVAVCGAGDDPEEARATLALAFDRGINAVTIDAGDADGVRLLGASLGQAPDKAGIHVIARPTSLVPFDLPSPHVPAQHAYPGAHLRAEVERLRTALGVERLALVQLHAWCPEWLHEGDWLDTLRRLRAEGKIAGFGISLFDHDIEAAPEAVASGMIDAVQLMHNVFDPAGAALFPHCQAHDVAMVVRAPLYYGAIAPGFGEAVFSDRDWRRGYFFDAHRRETVARVHNLADTTGSPERSVTDLALRFCLSHPAVSTVAVGMCRREHLEANLRAMLAGPLDADSRAALARHKWLV